MLNKHEMNTHKILLAVVMLFTVIMTSCDKENDLHNPANENQSTSQIIGTVWVNVENGDDWVDDDGNLRSYCDTETIMFNTEKDGEIRYSFRVEGLPAEDYDESFQFTYTYQSPNGTITATDQNETNTLTFTIQGDTMELQYNDDYFPVFFIKQ